MKRLLLVFSILFLSGCSIGGIFSKNPKEYVNANELGSAYVADEEAASDDYDDEYIQVTGVIKLVFVGKDEVEIQLFGGVICTFSKDIEITSELKMYNMIVVEGTVKGYEEFTFVSTVMIEECVLIEQLITPEIITTSEQVSRLNLGEIGYEIIEITGVVFSIDLRFRLGLNLIEDNENNLKIQFEEGFDLSGIEVGDTVIITGVVMPYTTDSYSGGYKIFGYDVGVGVKSE